jgi:hypothetical protein
LVREKIEADHHMKSLLHYIVWRRLALRVVVLAFHLPSAAQACSACVGAADATGASGGPGGPGGPMNAAIFLMLGCIGSVLSLLCAFAIYLYRRSQAPIPPHVQLAEMIGSQSK